MVQEFQVVRCFSCQSFQVQQVKKANRWSCKLCGEKQSLLKEFGRGSGADCRRHVQKLNANRGVMMEDQERHTLSLCANRKQVEVDAVAESEEHDQAEQAKVSHWSKYLDAPEKRDQAEQAKVSRWSKYLDEPKEADPEEEEEEENVMIDSRKRRRVGEWTDSWTPG